MENLNMPDKSTREPVSYDAAPPTPLRTVDRPTPDRAPTPEALAVLRDLVSDSSTPDAPTTMPAPHQGPRFSQRRAARLLLAGRSYQAVQAWLRGEPIPQTTAEFLLEDLRRVDAHAEDRVVQVYEDEIAIVVASGATASRKPARYTVYEVRADRDTGVWFGAPTPTTTTMTDDEFFALQDTDRCGYTTFEETLRDAYGMEMPPMTRLVRVVWED
jgi:hypothetical protein